MNTVIILAAGRGTRMGSNLNKQYLLLKGKPIIYYTIAAFERNPLIDNIIVVINKLDKDIFKDKIINKYKFKKISKVIPGGKERQNSVMIGLQEVPDDCDIVLVHDGARPFITDKIISRCVEGAREHHAVSTGVPVKDTIKVINNDRDVINTPKRSQLWITQTPQAFNVDLLKKAHIKADVEGFEGTDDSSLVERMGVSVKMVDGDYTNFKITTPEDLITAEAVLNHMKKIK